MKWVKKINCMLMDGETLQYTQKYTVYTEVKHNVHVKLIQCHKPVLPQQEINFKDTKEGP